MYLSKRMAQQTIAVCEKIFGEFFDKDHAFSINSYLFLEYGYLLPPLPAFNDVTVLDIILC